MKALDLQIEQTHQNTGVDYIDIISDFAQSNEVDIEDLVKELHPSTIDKLKHEFIKRRMVKGEKLEPTLEKFFT